MPIVHQTCHTLPGERWNVYLEDSATLILTEHTWRLTIVDARADAYTNAQIDDYDNCPRAELPWQPPVRMTVRARFSHSLAELRGTAGFGFWNNPISFSRRNPPTLPRAVWFFFASPPSNLYLDATVPGFGWKAAVIDALRAPFVATAPLLVLAMPVMHFQRVRRILWPFFQRQMKVGERALDIDMTGWHVYEIEWERAFTRFAIDGQTVLDGAPSPAGPLGFVTWMDNQYAVVTPWGRLWRGVLERPGEQWLEIASIDIETLNL